MTRPLRRGAWILVVLVLLGVLVWTGANLVGSWRYQSAIRDLRGEGFVLQLHEIAPPAVPATENAAPYYSAAFALYVAPPEEADWGSKKMRHWTPEARPAAEAWLKQNAEAFDLVRRAQKRPRCRFERDYSQGYSMLMPEVTGVLSLARALGTLADTQIVAGDGAAARESVKLIFSLGECLRDDPILVSQLVRWTAVAEALAVIEDAVKETTGEVDLREWQALLPPDSLLQGSIERAYRGEIAMARALLDTPSSEIGAPLVGFNRTSVGWDLMRPLVRYDSADYLFSMRRMVLACRKPYLEGVAEVEALRLAHFNPIWSPIRSRLMPALGRCLQRQAAVEARLMVVRAGLEAERVRKGSGAYPKSVAGTDPFSGKPLVYDLEKGRIASIRPTEGDQDRPTEWKLRVTK